MQKRVQTVSINTMKHEKCLRKTHINFPLYLMLIPGFIFTFLFSYMPMFGVVLAFKKLDLRKSIWGSDFVGLDNFNFIFRTEDAWLSMRNTLAYNLVFIITGLLFAVALAVAMSLIRNKLMAKTYQTLLIMPHFLSYVIVAYLVFAFLGMETGYLNNTILKTLFGSKLEINWYIEYKAWPVILFIVNTWKTVGYNSIIYLAAIAGIDTALYEAAEIDGAGIFKQIRYITLPSLKNIMIIMTILNLGKIFSADFGLFYNVTMNSGALYPTTYVINTYVYNMLMASGTASTGMASAAGLFQSSVGFVLIVVSNWIVKRIDAESALF